MKISNKPGTFSVFIELKLLYYWKKKLKKIRDRLRRFQDISLETQILAIKFLMKI